MAIFQSLQRFVRKTREKVGNFLPSRHRRRRESADSQTPLAPSTEGILVRGEIIYPPHRVSLDPEAPRRVSQPLPRQLSRGAQLDKFAAEGEDKSIEMRRTSRPREFVDLTTGNSPTHHRRNSTPTPFPRSPRSPRSPSPDQVPNTPRGIKRRHNLSQEPAESSSAATRQRREVIETIDMTGEGGPTLPLPRSAPAVGPGAPVDPPEANALLAYTCPICMERPENPTSTVCGHLFCHQCIMNYLTVALRAQPGRATTPRGACPVCRATITRRSRGPRELTALIFAREDREEEDLPSLEA